MTAPGLVRRCLAFALALAIALLCLASEDATPPPAVPMPADGVCPAGTEAAANLSTGALECVPIPGWTGPAPTAGGANLSGQITPVAR